MHLGWQEILLIVVIILVLFGAKRIPELARSIGKGAREFKKGLKEIENPDIEEEEKNQKKGLN